MATRSSLLSRVKALEARIATMVDGLNLIAVRSDTIERIMDSFEELEDLHKQVDDLLDQVDLLGG